MPTPESPSAPPAGDAHGSAYRRHEGLAVVLATTGVGALAGLGALPDRLGVGSFCAGLGLALLLQGFVRDLNTLAHQARRRRAGLAEPPPEERACLCLESVIGLPVVLAGLSLALAAAADTALVLATWAWPLASGLVWGLGYAIRDLVLEWSPRLRVTRIANHGSVLVQWRTRR